jgi:hypothetical protein
MTRFQLPFYNIAGCEAEQREDQLIEWLTERSDDEVKRTRTIYTSDYIEDDIKYQVWQEIPVDSPQWEDYWALEVPGLVKLVNTIGCKDWYHRREVMFLVYDNRSWDDFNLDENEIYIDIADEYLALQFKLIMHA